MGPNSQVRKKHIETPFRYKKAIFDPFRSDSTPIHKGFTLNAQLQNLFHQEVSYFFKDFIRKSAIFFTASSLSDVMALEDNTSPLTSIS